MLKYSLSFNPSNPQTLKNNKTRSKSKKGIKRSSFLKNIGTVLILTSVLFFLLIYAPFINLYINSKQLPPNIFDKDFSIRIDKINAYAKVVANVNPWDEKEYQTRLKNGVAHANGTALPDENGTTFLFAHSSDLPWRLTRYNTAFFRLGEVEKGDDIVVNYKGKEYKYQITDKKEVWPREVQYLTRSTKNWRESASPISENRLILQTCTPIGTDFKRLLVFAEQI